MYAIGTVDEDSGGYAIVSMNGQCELWVYVMNLTHEQENPQK